MSRHSKNNTAAPVFTYHERKTLQYGTVSQRLGKDSMKEYDSCSICVHAVRDPLCCKQGHLFCKECIFEYIMNQKSEIQKQEQLFVEQERRIQEAKELEQQRKKEEEIAQFDKTVLGIVPQRVETVVSTTKSEEAASAPAKSQPQEAVSPSKPKAQLPFWIPGTEKDVEPNLVKKPSKEVRCPEGGKPHVLKLKKLVKLNFTPNKSPTEDTVLRNRYQCAICCKTLVKGIKTIALAKCGHVACQGCFDKVKSSGTCFSCSQKFRDKDIISIQSGGSGYAANSGESLIAKKVTPSAWI